MRNLLLNLAVLFVSTMINAQTLETVFNTSEGYIKNVPHLYLYLNLLNIKLYHFLYREVISTKIRANFLFLLLQKAALAQPVEQRIRNA